MMSSTPFGERSCHRLGWSDGQREGSTLKAALLGDAHSFAAHRSGCSIVVRVPGLKWSSPCCNLVSVPSARLYRCWHIWRRGPHGSKAARAWQ